MRGCRHSETKVAEEYCWAITQTARRSCCGRSGSNELEFGVRLDSVVYTHIFDQVITHFRVAPHLPESNNFVSRELFIYQRTILRVLLILLLNIVYYF
jgi:hypothetical protein